MQSKKFVLVETDLLLQEKGFEDLRNFVANLDFDELQMYDEFCYDINKDEVVCIHPKLNPFISSMNFVCQEIKKGYIYTDLNNLKKLLSW